MAMLVSAVDWVVSFEEDTPLRLLEALRPDVLVKGGDYGIEQVVGGEMVRDYGGEVAVLNLVPDLSTTALVEKIRNL
jgi:D-beta-D-heptose 7-phosphate kinase/D-beta-D-heptose 1-phosphate adenosyltransferase